MITIMKETTGQVDNFFYQPHTYYVDRKAGKLHKFITACGQETVFTRPLKFDTRRRTFEILGQEK